MTNEAINDRFFSALEMLKSAGILQSEAAFCNRYDIDRRNLYRINQNRDTHSVKNEWLAHLVADFGISAEWLLTGVGSRFFDAKLEKCPQRLRAILASR